MQQKQLINSELQREMKIDGATYRMSREYTQERKLEAAFQAQLQTVISNSVSCGK